MAEPTLAAPLQAMLNDFDRMAEEVRRDPSKEQAARERLATMTATDANGYVWAMNEDAVWFRAQPGGQYELADARQFAESAPASPPGFSGNIFGASSAPTFEPPANSWGPPEQQATPFADNDPYAVPTSNAWDAQNDAWNKQAGWSQNDSSPKTKKPRNRGSSLPTFSSSNLGATIVKNRRIIAIIVIILVVVVAVIAELKPTVNSAWATYCQAEQNETAAIGSVNPNPTIVLPTSTASRATDLGAVQAQSAKVNQLSAALATLSNDAPTSDLKTTLGEMITVLSEVNTNNTQYQQLITDYPKDAKTIGNAALAISNKDGALASTFAGYNSTFTSLSTQGCPDS